MNFFQFLFDRIVFQPTGLSFPVNGVRLVREPKCSPIACDLELTDLKPSSAGVYRCEVSTEGPTFSIVQKTSNMTVAGALIVRKFSNVASIHYLIFIKCTS